jgi:hypothetical protein
MQKAVLSSKADEVARNGAHLKTEFRSEVFWAPLAFLIDPCRNQPNSNLKSGHDSSEPFLRNYS